MRPSTSRSWRHRLEQIAQLRALALRAKESADAATRRRKYHQALEIMEQLMQHNIAAKPFADFTKKLKDIDAIANPPPAGRPGQP